MAGMRCDVLIVGGGTGACAAAQALVGTGLRVIVTEPTDWIGGQLTSQMVPPDEHPWIEFFGSSVRYRRFRENVRMHYRLNEPLTTEARRNPYLNPGNGWVSRICHEPKVALAALMEPLKPTIASGRLQILLRTVPVSADVEGDRIRSVTVRSEGGEETVIEARMVLDATETGDLLPLVGAEYVLGAESRDETGEPDAMEGPHETENVQSFTWVFALASEPGKTFESVEPEGYTHWRNQQPLGWPFPQVGWKYYDVGRSREREFDLYSGPVMGLFTYRQIIDAALFQDERASVSLINWPQNDYQGGTILDVPEATVTERMRDAKRLSQALYHWLKTEAPRPDGGHGYPELRLAPEISGTEDGFAMAPYIRESRRIRARFTILQQHVSAAGNPGRDRGAEFWDSVGTGAYPIDLHPSASGSRGIDGATVPFHLPLGALIPVRLRNLLPACKNIGVTHITNGCYRLHPVEWVIGEVCGHLSEFCLGRGLDPADVYESEELVAEFQAFIRSQGIETHWPKLKVLGD